MNIKKIFLAVFFLATVNLFAQPGHFMLQLDGKLLYSGFEAIKSGSFLVSPFPYPLIDFIYQIPEKSSVKSYFGLELLPLFPMAFYSSVNNKTGYAFNKPEKWKKYHIELLGSVGIGVAGIFAKQTLIYPVGELGCQVYWMPEDKGFFWGLGPELHFILDCYEDQEVELNHDLTFNIGYKF